MRKQYRYGIFIASAILACAPLAMNNSVAKADAVEGQKKAQGTTGTAKPAAGNINGQQGAANNDQQAGQKVVASKDSQQGQSSENVYQGNQPQSGAAGKVKDITQQDSGKLNENLGVANKDQNENGHKGYVYVDHNKDSDQQEPIITIQPPKGDPNYKDTRGDTLETARVITYQYTSDMHTEIKATKGLTVGDIAHYYRKHARLLMDGKYLIEGNPTFIAEDKDDREVRRSDDPESLLLEPGDQVAFTLDLVGLFQSNKWFKWQLPNDGFMHFDPVKEAQVGLGSIPDDIANRIHEDKSTNTIALKTDDKGILPRIIGSKDLPNSKYRRVFRFGTNQIAPIVIFTISDGANKDAIEIPHNPEIVGKQRNYIGNAPVAPTDDNKGNQATDNKGNQVVNNDIPDDENSSSSNEKEISTNNETDFQFTQASTTDVENTIKESEANSKDVTTTEKTGSDSKDTAESNNSVSNDENITTSNDVGNLIFIHNAYIYRKDGKLVSKRGAYRYKSLYSKAKILDGGHTTSIKIGKKVYKCYRIGKNEYVKVANIGKTPKPQKVNTRGTIKASSKYGVKLYNSKGKFTKKILTKSKKVRFDQKKFMRGTVFYRIKGTNTWVRKGNIKF